MNERPDEHDALFLATDASLDRCGTAALIAFTACCCERLVPFHREFVVRTPTYPSYIRRPNAASAGAIEVAARGLDLAWDLALDPDRSDPHALPLANELRDWSPMDADGTEPALPGGAPAGVFLLEGLAEILDPRERDRLENAALQASNTYHVSYWKFGRFDTTPSDDGWFQANNPASMLELRTQVRQVQLLEREPLTPGVLAELRAESRRIGLEVFELTIPWY